VQSWCIVKELLAASFFAITFSYSLRLTKQPRTVFDCIVPKIVPTPEAVWRAFADSPNTQEVKEMKQKLEQEWLEHIKTLNRQELEGELSWAEGQQEGLPERPKPMPLEYVQKLEWQLEAIREQLRQREG
jgi:hypothetical protein